MLVIHSPSSLFTSYHALYACYRNYVLDWVSCILTLFHSEGGVTKAIDRVSTPEFKLERMRHCENAGGVLAPGSMFTQRLVAEISPQTCLCVTESSHRGEGEGFGYRLPRKLCGIVGVILPCVLPSSGEYMCKKSGFYVF